MQAAENKRTKKTRIFSFFWGLAVTPSTFVILALLWCLDLGLGSVGAYKINQNFSAQMDAYPLRAWLLSVAPKIYPDSLWVYILVGLTWLMVLSLFFCSMNWLLHRRKRWVGMGEVLVHMGFLAIFSGFVVGAIWGEREQGIVVPLHDETEVSGQRVALSVQSLREVKSRDGRVLDTVTNLTLHKERGSAVAAEVRLNHPLIDGSTVVYSRGAMEQLTHVVLNLNGRKKMLRAGETVNLSPETKLLIDSILQPNERRGMAMGPGVLLTFRDEKRELAKREVYLTTLAANRRAVRLPQGITIKLMSFQSQRVALYDVHYDPGIRFVLWGTWLLGVGTFWFLCSYLLHMKRWVPRADS